ncbi:MAG TPA: DUF6544 family protein, partial [Gemmatimonadales bacterium]
AVVLGAGAAAGTAGVAIATRRWTAETQRLLDVLAESAPGAPRTVSLESLAALPPPVKRYFLGVLKDKQPFIDQAVIEQSGEFRSKESDDVESGWQPFTATQVFGTWPPGFIWDARIRMGPVGAVWVRDSYLARRASMVGAIMGTIPVVNEPDTPDLRAGALQRYLAESVWFPTALLPESGVRWSPIDDSHARAALTEGAITVSLDFEFGDDGRILSTYTPGRRRADPGKKGEYLTLPWGGRYRGYQEQDGMLLPSESEVYWVVAGREQPYYRGKNVRTEYHFR